LATSIANERRSPVDGFGLRLPRERGPDLLRICETWRPDVVVWEETDLAGGLVAERRGIPHARLLVLAEGTFFGPEVLAEPIRVLRMEHGLPPDPGLEMLGRHLVLSPFPPSFRDPAVRLPATAHDIRPAALGFGTADASPRWRPGGSARPIVYLTLGTVFPLESGDLFARVTSALRTLPVELIVTVGPDLDPAELGPQPPNVHVERWIPQHEVLPHCDVVVSHGGSGSVIGALAHGVPLVLIPIGADQLRNAARCVALGVGRELDPLTATRREIREAVSAILAEPTYRHAARRMADESAALPDASHAVTLIEQLAAGEHDALPQPSAPLGGYHRRACTPQTVPGRARSDRAEE
jgi:UDP:flavonoid glycosyltransferase YjiC (YdhE family)